MGVEIGSRWFYKGKDREYDVKVDWIKEYWSGFVVCVGLGVMCDVGNVVDGKERGNGEMWVWVFKRFVRE